MLTITKRSALYVFYRIPDSHGVGVSILFVQYNGSGLFETYLGIVITVSCFLFEFLSAGEYIFYQTPGHNDDTLRRRKDCEGASPYIKYLYEYFNLMTRIHNYDDEGRGGRKNYACMLGLD